MNSLRSRLIVGSSLIAVAPLALGMLLLSAHIESAVRSQAAERLNAALGGLREQLAADGERIAEKLRILARDPTLRRLYLVRSASGRDLAEYLAERRTLLDLDFLEVAGDPAAPAEEPAGGGGRASAAGAAIRPLEGGARRGLTAAAPIRYLDREVGSLRGGVWLDDRFLARLQRASGLDLALRDAGGRIAASTLGGAAPPSLPAAGELRRVRVAGRPYLSMSFPLAPGAGSGESIVGLVPTASADRTIATLQLTSALLGALGLALAVLLGALWSSQVSRPVERLAAYSEQLARGEWNEPLALRSVAELQTLVAALDRMRRDLQAYRERLVTTERQAAWSLMARKVAHEIKNPLTPIAISMADLRRSFEQRRPDFPQILEQATRTVADEVETLKGLLQEFSDFGRLPAPVLAPCPLSAVFAELETLYGRDVAEGRLTFAAPEREIVLRADAGQLRQALVNLIKNGLESGGRRVAVSAGLEAGAAELRVSDDGPGLAPEQRAQLFVPGFTTKAHGSGLGLTIVQRIVNDHGGTIAVDSGAAAGTTFRLRFPLEEVS